MSLSKALQAARKADEERRTASILPSRISTNALAYGTLAHEHDLPGTRAPYPVNTMWAQNLSWRGSVNYRPEDTIQEMAEDKATGNLVIATYMWPDDLETTANLRLRTPDFAHDDRSWELEDGVSSLSLSTSDQPLILYAYLGRLKGYETD